MYIFYQTNLKKTKMEEFNARNYLHDLGNQESFLL